MTENKAQKAAIRKRMAKAGEPYSVARRAVLGRTHVTSRPAASWPEGVPSEKPWDERIPGGKPWDEEIPEDKPWDEEPPDDWSSGGQAWMEQYYADGAATEGISVEEFKARMASHRGRQWAGSAQPHRPPPGTSLPRLPRMPRPPRMPRGRRLPRLLEMVLDPDARPPWWLPGRSETRHAEPSRPPAPMRPPAPRPPAPRPPAPRPPAPAGPPATMGPPEPMGPAEPMGPPEPTAPPEPTRPPGPTVQEEPTGPRGDD